MNESRIDPAVGGKDKLISQVPAYSFLMALRVARKMRPVQMILSRKMMCSKDSIISHKISWEGVGEPWGEKEKKKKAILRILLNSS